MGVVIPFRRSGDDHRPGEKFSAEVILFPSVREVPVEPRPESCGMCLMGPGGEFEGVCPHGYTPHAFPCPDFVLDLGGGGWKADGYE